MNCDLLPVVPNRFYGGLTGSKIAVKYNDCVWMLKSQQTLKERNFKNVELLYANDVLSEHIGSNIYKVFNIPVHETILGKYKGKQCVLCQDLAYPDRVVEFREFRNALFDEQLIQHSSGMSTKISDIMQVIEVSDRLPKEDAIERFWSMFVIDSLIGNTDRNNGNWGFLWNGSSFELYPVYDCGGCLSNKRSDKQMKEDLESGNVRRIALDYTLNYRNDKGRRINPFHYISRHSNKYIEKTLSLFTRDRLDEILSVIDSNSEFLSKERKEWYKKVLHIRYKALILS